MVATIGLLGSLFKIGASIIGSGSAKKASKAAQAAQIAGINSGMTALNNQYDYAKEQSSPWVSGGQAAQDELLNLLGISSPKTDWNAYATANPNLTQYYQQHGGQNLFKQGDAMSLQDFAKAHQQQYGGDISPFTTSSGGDQGAAIEQLKNSPVYQALFGNGVDTTLANASATGGLRGGNTQDALARVGTDTLAKVYQDRVANLSGVSGQGLNAVTGLENLGAANAGSIAALFGQQGDVNAGGILQRSAINQQMLNTVAKEAGKIGDSAMGGLPF